MLLAQYPKQKISEEDVKGKIHYRNPHQVQISVQEQVAEGFQNICLV
jgi:hypothetical protein